MITGVYRSISNICTLYYKLRCDENKNTVQYSDAGITVKNTIINLGHTAQQIVASKNTRQSKLILISEVY